MSTQLTHLLDKFANTLPNTHAFTGGVTSLLETASLMCNEQIGPVDTNPILPIDQIRNGKVVTTKLPVFTPDQRTKSMMHTFKFSVQMTPPINNAAAHKKRTLTGDFVARRVRVSTTEGAKTTCRDLLSQVPLVPLVPTAPLFASVSVQTSPLLHAQPTQPLFSQVPPLELPSLQHAFCADEIMQALHSIDSVALDAGDTNHHHHHTKGRSNDCESGSAEQRVAPATAPPPPVAATPTKTTNPVCAVNIRRPPRSAKPPTRFDDDDEMSSTTPPRAAPPPARRGRGRPRKIFGQKTGPTTSPADDALAAGSVCTCCQKRLTAKDLSSIPLGAFYAA